MSFVETNPTITKSTELIRPNQVIHTRDSQFLNVQFNNIAPFITGTAKIPLLQQSIVNVSAMEKPEASFTWTTTQLRDATVYTYDVTIAKLKELVTLGFDKQRYFRAMNLCMRLNRAENAAYAGYAILAFNPTPSNSYHSNIFGITNSFKNAIHLEYKPIRPTDPDDIVLKVPIDVPFNLFPTAASSSNDPMAAYLHNYQVGTFMIIIGSQLRTNGTRLNLTYRVSTFLEGLQTSGPNFNE